MLVWGRNSFTREKLVDIGVYSVGSQARGFFPPEISWTCGPRFANPLTSGWLLVVSPSTQPRCVCVPWYCVLSWTMPLFLWWHCSTEVVPCLLTFSDWYCHLFILCLLRQLVLETLLVATACSYYFLCQAWQTWTCFLAFVQRACCHTGASRWSGGQPSLSLPFLRSLHCWCDRVFQPPDHQCSHLGPLALFCTADTLLIASCLFWSENWLVAYFLPPPSPIVSFASIGVFCHSNTSPA